MIYLDNAATTYPKPESVLSALDNANRNAFNTGRGGYNVARKSTLLIDEVRNKLLSLNEIKEGNVILLPSATIALNTIIFGLDLKKNDNVYVSPFEHNAIMRALHELQKRIGINIEVIPFDKKTWKLDEKKLSNMFALKKPSAIMISHISNVTGFILPYGEIFSLSQKYNSINILDASQSYGIIKIDDLSNINFIAFAGHKSLYSSFGIAGYINLKSTNLKPLLYGGTGSDSLNLDMPDGGSSRFESGSSNIVAITGLNASIDWIIKNNIFSEEKKLTEYMIEELKKIKKVKLFLPENYDNIFGVVSFAVKDYSSDEVGKILNDEYDICVRTGYHCAPLVHDFIGSKEYNGTVRVSLSYFSNIEEVDALVNAIKSL